ncbi:5-bromo-4-chloroindolyl phosphate hydrolysis family protein [Nereida sp. MMG025]|uniref:5-bromo-4-chloroindolyl phosphate hydrolysis family protein n=1 Tax=Nereida sp. MMG025 TaxID=2909981 RepID=UPI001F3CF5E6|nr:5-bromo-4-chloroindolyl phosphate hydrolysis family protein [Nereida sp. MMG025]MCF6443960.1 5-bromo-4-chloroindolyl phosphate hydrolysis family protein [Nereida sp. MMG025]
MAQRFGGKYSPDGSKPVGQQDQGFAGKKRTRAGGRVNILFFAPFPLALRAFRGEPAELAINLVAFGLLMLAAWLTREGIIAQEAYDSRKVARKPAFPRKMAASVLTGLGLAIAGFAGAESLLTPIIFGVAGAALHFFAFGPDPLKNKGMEGVDSFQQDRVAAAIDKGEAHLKTMREAILRTSDRALIDRVDGFSGTARQMFRTIEEDPRDLSGARKFVGVYLQGASDATAKFADLYSRNRDTQVRADYEALLSDLEQNFAARTEKMLLDDRTDMDIEIKVLRDRLQREGLRVDRNN